MSHRATTAIAALSDAFRTRDLEAALACFADDAHVTYVGSEQGELAVGPEALRELFARIFERNEAYSWETEEVWSSEHGDLCTIVATLCGTVHGDSGRTERFPYVLTGLLRTENGTGRWLLCHGAEPTNCALVGSL